MGEICLPFSLQRQDHSTELNWQSCISDGGAHYDGDDDGDGDGDGDGDDGGGGDGDVISKIIVKSE